MKDVKSRNTTTRAKLTHHEFNLNLPLCTPLPSSLTAQPPPGPVPSRYRSVLHASFAFHKPSNSATSKFPLVFFFEGLQLNDQQTIPNTFTSTCGLSPLTSYWFRSQSLWLWGLWGTGAWLSLHSGLLEPLGHQTNPNASWHSVNTSAAFPNHILYNKKDTNSELWKVSTSGLPTVMQIRPARGRAASCSETTDPSPCLAHTKYWGLD